MKGLCAFNCIGTPFIVKTARTIVLSIYGRKLTVATPPLTAGELAVSSLAYAQMTVWSSP